MRRPALLRATLVAMLAVPLVVHAQAGVQLRGRLLSADGMPVAGATVSIASLGYSVKSDSSGRFTLGGSAGSTLRLGFAAPGFRPDTASIVLPRRGAVERDFMLLDHDAPLPEANPSDRVLSGRVTDPQGTPLAYANLQLNGGRRVVSDDSGRFRIPVTTGGGLALLVRRIGFEPTEVRLSSMPDTAVAVRMIPTAVSLPETRVTAAPFQSLDMHGFYRRMADAERGINRGYFITPEELEQRRPRLVTSVVDGLPNLRIRQAAMFPPTPYPQNLRIEDARGCPMTVFLDRILIQPMRRRGAIENEAVNSLVTATSLAGAEVYPRTLSAPPEFPPMEGTCGVVLLWTK